MLAYEMNRLIEMRLVIAHGHLDGERAAELCSQLMTLDALGVGEPITLHLRLASADLEAAFAVVDTMDVLSCPTHALVVGQLGGAALAVLAAARERQITPNAMIRLIEPREQSGGTAAEMALFEEEHRRLVGALYDRLALVTGRSVEEIRDDAHRGRIFGADQAVAYGFVHDVAGSPPPGLG
ncbi:ATP-dependent Clp protease proteolytic subunit [Actinomadura rubrisoli]|uniref:ATP-dependent Clp protease proteolytic subunit n=1 Tax=Actinomadura rubrisoli TaxID=2530368 RepID=UPI00140527EC|nr:ATP-dependent Clp protease proteolytic subunit [Actinomadura rubrisoli]